MSRYFSNSTDGGAWERAWCDSCEQDHGFHPTGDQRLGCEIFLRAVVDEEVPEWTMREGPPFHLPPDIVCSGYRPCTRGSCSGDPQPDARAAVRVRVAEAQP